MKTKTTSLFSAASTYRRAVAPTVAHFVQRFTNAAAMRARFPVPPLGSLWDPHLLDRLHAPLTRYRD